MAKCIKCGKHGLFFKVNHKGICTDCEASEKREIEEARKRYLQEKKRKAEDDWNKLCSLPKCNIIRSSNKIKVQQTSFLKDLNFSNITAKSSLEKLGKFVVVDIETTGLSAVHDDVVEIAAIKFENFIPVEIFETYIFPTKGIKEEAAKVNKITEDMVDGAPLLYEVIPSLQEFIFGYNLVAHNFEFDFKFLCRGGLDIVSDKRKYFDTMQIAQKMLKKPKYKYDKEWEEYVIDYNSDYDVEDHKLDTLCSYYGIARNNEHRALSDCYDTARLFKKLAEDKIL
ncbi:MAG: 3'-5' exonuclease [Ruminococcaceae bacterium]|nr:3'-5' exonuclease [Oscillospiraceae bacterium]